MDYGIIKMFENHVKTLDEQERRELRQKHAEELKILEGGHLLKMSPERLATWQSEYEPDEPQWVLADQEWKRRQGITIRRIAIVAIIISGLSLLIATLAFFHSLNGDGSSPILLKPPAQSDKSPP